MKLSIIIPAYNEEKYIWFCIDHIIKSDVSHNIHEIIVVDNNSTDNTFQIASSYISVDDRMLVIKENNKWTNFARQRWYLEATWDVLAFIDADCHLSERWLDNVFDIFKNSWNIWQATWWYLYYDAWFLQNLYSKVIWYIRVPILYIFVWYIWNWGNMIFRKKILDDIWWFDTKLKFYWDDINTVSRASKITKCIYSRKIIVDTSYRRFNWWWFINTNMTYVIAFFRELFWFQQKTKMNHYR